MLTSRDLNVPKLKKIWHRYAYLPGQSTSQGMFHLVIIVGIFSITSAYFANHPIVDTENTPKVNAERCDGC